MVLKNRARRAACVVMSASMLLCNLFSGVTAFAVGPDSPVNPDGSIPNGNKPQDTTHTEGAYINDTPIRLQVSKLKTAVGDHEGIAPVNTDAAQDDTITYKLSGRIDGAEADIVNKYGADKVELAYSSNGIYLGYGWYKGTYEYLLNRKAQSLDEEVQIIFNEYGVFSGYAYITRKLQTADDVNRYVAGATMGLFEAVEIFRDPSVTLDDTYYGEDERFLGVTVERDPGSNNVTNVYVNKGYAGTRVEYVLQKEDGEKIEIDGNGRIIDRNYNYQDSINDKGKGTWIAKTIQREDTPILYYSLDNLRITSNDVYTNISADNESILDNTFGAERYDKEGRLYGFDKAGNVVDITQMDELDFSVFGFEAGTSRPVYEFVGGDFNKIRYSMPEKNIQVGAGTVMYHLDEDGNRDAMVDPQTGIAYIEEEITPPEGHDNIHDVNDTESTKNTKIFVWPVNVFYDGSGADVGNKNGSKTFQKIMTTRVATINADTEDEYTTGTYRDGNFVKSQNPVLDKYGHPVYYRQSDEVYVKGHDAYDYDGDEYIGYTYTDQLDQQNEDAYTVNNHDSLYNGDKDDPFDQSTHYQYSDKQPVKVTVDLDGNYIVNGADVVPVPVRPGYVFAGWLMEPDQLTDGGTVKAYWRNQNSSGMNETEKQQWYSDREASGTNVKTLTVTFDANDGEFRAGSGDIHSTDNILYRRLGDAYLIENVWMTGENTPNDPFDTRLVDTVENTADGKDTISHTGKTGNDAYSSDTNAGGQADMLKRVNVGIYIMEEMKSPAGYVKGLPVGVTVNEHDQIQYTEMVDKTIKVELIKADATDDYERALYIDGVLQKTDDGKNVKVHEPKGAWSFKHVPGATLSMKAADDATRKPFSNWVEITSDTDFVKKEEGGYYYFEFQSDQPLFLEGIPLGNYVISEVVTPPGYVTMKDKRITVTEADGVQIYDMNDDHTKVEIEKYYNDETGKHNLPNAYRAKLSLAETNGEEVASWYTDDMSDYTGDIAELADAPVKKTLFQRIISLFQPIDLKANNFVTAFTEAANSGSPDTLAEFSWNVTREASKASYSTYDEEVWILSDGSRVTCSKGEAPDDVPQAFKDAYNTRNLEENKFTYTETITMTKDPGKSPNLSDQVWDVSNGSKMHVSINQSNETGENGRLTYTVDFKFNYRDDYTGRFENTISYDTIDGRHRFDYLPEGVYTLKEAEAPEGFMAAKDIAITVQPNGEVQRFTLENKRKQMEIAKIAAIGESYYAGNLDNTAQENEDITRSAVIPGASLSLYYSETPIANYGTAFADGKVPAGATLADSWISGEDGKYTQTDLTMELIRDDQVGDYKPHTVASVKNGYYYLVETQTPGYYKTFSVMEIPVTDFTTAEQLFGIRAINTPIPMEVRVYKHNEQGSPLAGAMFEVRNKTLGGVFVGTLSTDESGYGSLIVTDIGRFIAEGGLEPYTFTIQEISAPAGYRLNESIHEFKPADNMHGLTTKMVNESDGAIIDGVLDVTDTPSEITISKSDFGTGEAVPGTTLAVYEATNEGGTWKNSGVAQDASWKWTLKANEITHEVTGLSAGGNYVLIEEAVPKGYTRADDIFFHVSPSGNSIDRIWYDPEENSYISFKEDSTGAVESVTFSTRTVLGTYVELEDLATGDKQNKGTLTGGVVNLSSDDVVDGHHYRLKEFVKYSDNSVDCLSTTTFIAKLYNDWTQVDLNRDLTGITVSIDDNKGNSVVSFKPDNTGSRTIVNPLMSDPDGLTVVGSVMQSIGVNHKAVQSGNQIRYEISYLGEGKEIVVIPAKGLTYLRTDGFAFDGNVYRATTENNSGTYTIIGTVNAGATGYIDQQISIDGKSYSYLNPVAVNKGEGVFANTSKLAISNAVAGTHQENENAAFTFKITLTKADGSPLSGGYDYRTRYTNGQFRALGSETEFTLTVNGDDFIVINELPYNTKYSVVEVVPEGFDFVVTNTKADGSTSQTEVSNVLFTNTRNESTERTLFKKNTGYVLTENLCFDNDDTMVLNKYSFTFGENCQVKDLGMYNKPTEVWFSKTDWTDCEEVEGATCVLTDEEGNLLTDALGNEMKWVSGKDPKIFVGVLEAGKTYRYHEEKAPDGYGYSEDVVFTVSEDGTIDKVVMQDKLTGVSFTKEDFAGHEVPGATCELKVYNEETDTWDEVDEWVSGTSPHVIEGVLTPDRTYHYHEAAAPDGYAYSEDIEFTIDKDGIVTDAHYVDEDGNTILFDEDGYPTDIVDHEDGTYSLDGETIIINEDGDAENEEGEIVARGVERDIPIENNVVQMKDAPFHATFEKRDYAGEEIPGASCELKKVNPDGTEETVDEWVSEPGKPRIEEGNLQAGGTYRYHEELAPEGYGYSEDIEFTIDKDGVITDAHYLDEDGNTVLFDEDGFPTEIVVHEDGTYSHNGEEIFIDENGDAVDKDGEVHAKGVEKDIPIKDNAVQMKDAPTQVNLIKLDKEGNPIAGATFQILEKDGTPAVAVKDTLMESVEHDGNILAGEELIFLSDGSREGVNVTGQLKAGEDYILREIKPPKGYIAGEDKEFHMPYLNQKEPISVTMENEPTKVTFEKRDYAGEEIPGASCELKKVNPDGTEETIDKWVSGEPGNPRVEEGKMETDTTYRYHEELAPEGYGYSEDIEFTVDKDGVIKDAHYLDEDGNTVLFDEDGFPTEIVVHEDGTYSHNGEEIFIDENGDAVDKDGNVHAKGVEKDIPIKDNVVQMKDAPTQVLIQKVDLNGKVLEGGKFQILEENGKPVTAVKDTLIASTEHDGNILAGEEIIFEALLEGVNITGQLKAGETYLMRELEAPAKHVKGEDVEFTVPYLNQKEPLEVPMSNTPTKVTFDKQDYAGEEIPGASCELKKVNPDGTEETIDKWVSGNEPRVEEGQMETDTTYRYHEELAPEGYGYSEDIEFTVDADGVIKDAHYLDEDGNTVLFDEDGFPTEIVVHEDGTYSHNGEEIFIDENGDAVDKDGNIHAKGVEKDIPIVDNVVVMKDAPTQMLFQKTDMEGKVLTGGKFQILNLDGTPVTAVKDSAPEADGTVRFKKGAHLVFPSTREGINITGMLKAGQDYILWEIESPDGYVKGDDVRFTIPYLNQKEPVQVAMTDKTTMVELLKTDLSGNPVSGAKLEVRDAANWDLIDEWTSTKEAHTLTGKLVAGKEYALVEAEAPDGYYRSEPVHFTVSERTDTVTVKMTDNPVVVKLIKVRKGTTERLNGGTFTVLRKKDNAVVIPEFTLNGELTITGKLNAGETYLFHEVTAPSGYNTAGDVEFTIPFEMDKDVIEITMEDPKKSTPSGGGGGGSSHTTGGPGSSSVTFSKYDGLTMKALPGATFTIYDSNGKIYKTVTTDSQGKASVTFSTAGTYTYKETKAPDGYVLNNEEHTITVTSSGTLTESVANYKNPPKVTVYKKDSETGEPISGVRFEIYNEEGKVVYSGTTDSYGQVIFSPDEYGAYAVRETRVPDDYELSDGYITFTVSEGGIEGETTFYNMKLDEEKPIPPKDRQNPGKSSGIITSTYYNFNEDDTARGWFDKDGNWHPFATLSDTGDRYPFMILALLMCVGTCGIVATGRRKEKKDEEL